jgi:hypothetical protein
MPYFRREGFRFNEIVRRADVDRPSPVNEIVSHAEMRLLVTRSDLINTAALARFYERDCQA